MGLHLVPLDDVPGPVVAEHRVGGVFHIPLHVVADLSHDLRLVGTGPVPRRGEGEPPHPPGVGGHLGGVVLEAGHRGGAGEQGHVPQNLRGLELAPHPLEVGHGPAHLVRGQEEAQVVPGLQQNALRLHQALAHRPVGGLAEVPSLGVLHMGPAGEQGDGHVGEGGAGEHPQMLLLHQVGEDEPLPVPVQHVLGTGGGQVEAGAPWGGL